MDAIILDFAKALNTVPQKRLVTKLITLNLRPELCK